MMAFYKILENDGSARMGVGKWPLPDGRAGDWLEVKGDLVPCQNGLHLCRRDDLIEWLGPAIFTAEYHGEMVEADDKIVVRRARLLKKLDTWNDRTARLFACDCAERVLHFYEKQYPNDSRVRNAIEVARKVANGDLSRSELAAARDAAGDAARDAAGAAAWNAAWAAAWAAAWDARAVAGTAERKWQTARLFEYLDGHIE